MPRNLSRLRGSCRLWAARCLVPALFLAATGLVGRFLPARPLATLSTPERPHHLSFSHDGRLLLTEGPPLRCWEVRTGRELATPLTEAARAGQAEFVSGGGLLWVRRYDPIAGAWSLSFLETATGREWLRFDAAPCSSDCLSADGRWLAFRPAHPADAGMEVWDIRARRRVATLGPGSPAALSPGGRSLVSFASAERKELTLWDVPSGQERGRMAGPGPCRDVQFSPDGSTAAVNFPCPPAAFLRLWDVATGRERATLPAADRFAFVLDGRLLATYGRYHYPWFWDVATGREVENVLPRPPAGVLPYGTKRVSPDGRTLAVEVETPRYPPWRPPSWQFWNWQPAEWQFWKWTRAQSLLPSHELRLFDVASGRHLGTQEGSAGEDAYVFSPDGRLLAVTKEGGTVAVWQVPPRKPLWQAAGLAGLFVLAVVLAVRWASRRRRTEAVASPASSGS
jgi:WD40 repeat protein